MRTLIRQVSIFDGTGIASQLGSVLVDGERIARVALGEDALAGEAAEVVIDGTGKTLMPGGVGP
ncbi:hypothetical protein [Novosphingobium sp. KN65.2]|uniref:hypothetical protein n=1 Tax=Novosphingobium sp. KN65.2 TaxID=1478134 RepID=UPI0005E958A7|nr:hypothetical protein [Novosphingobium sp. KN65.2]CDO35479.1 hypothetical protein SPHV1_2250080 [Novosphingobium sp. KN65.2]